MTQPYFIGLMSGTSADGIDAVLITTEGNQSELVGSHHRPMPAPLRDEILAFRQSGRDELHRLATLDVQLAEEYAVAVSTLLKATQLEAATVTAIGCHGQTLRHHPEGNTPFTLQIGDPNRLAELTGITVVSDFRRRDMAAGGQGAPLVPAFHRARLVSEGISTAVVNIGGIANISLVTAGGDVTGWDTGPGNTLMDAWIAKHQGEPFDRDGEWAASGAVIAPLLGALLQDPYFSYAPAKKYRPGIFSSRLVGDAPEWRRGTSRRAVHAGRAYSGKPRAGAGATAPRCGQGLWGRCSQCLAHAAADRSAGGHGRDHHRGHRCGS